MTPLAKPTCARLPLLARALVAFAFLFVIPILLLPLNSRAAQSNRVVTKHGSVSIVSATHSASGTTLDLGLLFETNPGWHIYWSDPGDAGDPPSIAITAPAKTRISAFTWPAPAWLRLGSVGDYVESGTVLLPFTATLAHRVGSQGASVMASANWLICSETICVPEQGIFALHLPAGPAGPSAQMLARQNLSHSRARD